MVMSSWGSGEWVWDTRVSRVRETGKLGKEGKKPTSYVVMWPSWDRLSQTLYLGTFQLERLEGGRERNLPAES